MGCDAIDDDRPIGGSARSIKAESGHGIGRLTAVAEHARAHRPRIAERLLPLNGIDVVGGHLGPTCCGCVLVRLG